MSSEKIKVIVIDDSIVVRRILARTLNEDPQIEVVATAEDPYDAEGKILKFKPDVLTLDIEMPKMDGITFLKILMSKRPMPVVVMSSLSQEGSKYAIDALNYGAVDILAKPYGPYSVGNVAPQLIEKVKAAAISNIRRLPTQRAIPDRKAMGSMERKTTVHAPSPATKPTGEEPPVKKIIPTGKTHFLPNQIILLGASTGGTEALREVIRTFPKEMPGICIVQHIPPYFSKAFADRMNQVCDLYVKEAEDGEYVEPGKVLVAPGDHHMLLKRHGVKYRVVLKQGPPVWHQRPAVDILFKTAAEIVDKNSVAALLTGMGRDGAEGLLELKKRGVKTFAQDEDSCVVYGMPKAAVDLGAADQILPLNQIAKAIYQQLTA